MMYYIYSSIPTPSGATLHFHHISIRGSIQWVDQLLCTQRTVYLYVKSCGFHDDY